MAYLFTFLEGICAFISPCMLPLLPLYLSYFAGADGKEKGAGRRVFIRSVCFVAGFAAVYGLLGVFAGTVGYFLNSYRTVFNIVCGIIVILFGLSYLEVIRIPIFKGMNTERRADGIISAFIFGIIFSVSLSPCTGAFLGSALMQASTSGTVLRGFSLLIVYSLGLGVPFIVSALLINKLERMFAFIKKHYKTVNLICGIFLILIGVLMALGLLDRAADILL